MRIIHEFYRGTKRLTKNLILGRVDIRFDSRDTWIGVFHDTRYLLQYSLGILDIYISIIPTIIFHVMLVVYNKRLTNDRLSELRRREENSGSKQNLL